MSSSQPDYSPHRPPSPRALRTGCWESLFSSLVHRPSRRIQCPRTQPWGTRIIWRRGWRAEEQRELRMWKRWVPEVKGCKKKFFWHMLNTARKTCPETAATGERDGAYCRIVGTCGDSEPSGQEQGVDGKLLWGTWLGIKGGWKEEELDGYQGWGNSWQTALAGFFAKTGLSLPRTGSRTKPTQRNT